MDRLTNKKEILNAISTLKSGKRFGSDEIGNEFLKEAALILTEQLVDLFNSYIKNGNIDRKILEGIVVLLWKKDNKSVPSNQRPITLLNSL